MNSKFASGRYEHACILINCNYLYSHVCFHAVMVEIMRKAHFAELHVHVRHALIHMLVLSLSALVSLLCIHCKRML